MGFKTITSMLSVTRAMLYQLSYEASLEAGQVQFVPVIDGFKSCWSLRIFFPGLYL